MDTMSIKLRSRKKKVGSLRTALIVMGLLAHGAALAQDPDLKKGFPVQAFHSAGTYYGGPSIYTLVGNLDEDPTLEIVVTGLSTGPLYAWKSDGTLVPGWPVSGVLGAGYAALGHLSEEFPGFQVFSGHAGRLVAYAGSGTALPGWPARLGARPPPNSPW